MENLIGYNSIDEKIKYLKLDIDIYERGLKNYETGSRQHDLLLKKIEDKKQLINKLQQNQ